MPFYGSFGGSQNWPTTEQYALGSTQAFLKDARDRQALGLQQQRSAQEFGLAQAQLGEQQRQFNARLKMAQSVMGRAFGGNMAGTGGYATSGYGAPANTPFDVFQGYLRGYQGIHSPAALQGATNQFLAQNPGATQPFPGRVTGPGIGGGGGGPGGPGGPGGGLFGPPTPLMQQKINSIRARAVAQGDTLARELGEGAAGKGFGVTSPAITQMQLAARQRARGTGDQQALDWQLGAEEARVREALQRQGLAQNLYATNLQAQLDRERMAQTLNLAQMQIPMQLIGGLL